MSRFITKNNHGRRIDTARQFRPDYGIEGPEVDDFLKQEGAMHGLAYALWIVIGIAAVACAALSIGYFGRHLGLF